jgi:hypothetical protein
VELIGVRIVEAPAAGRVRLVGDVRYEGASAPEAYWYEVSEELAGDLSRTGNPWVASLLPLAATLGEPLRVRLPVDELLLRGAEEILAVWSAWYPNLRVIPVEADPCTSQASGRRAGAFFTGGVHSAFTAVTHARVPPSDDPIDDLITIAGLDISLGHEEAIRRRVERLGAAATRLGLELCAISTNLKETRLREADWHDVSHGAMIVSAGLALEGRFGRLLVASTKPYGSLLPLGSHPLTDPLLSTESTRVLHDGAMRSRGEKLARIAESDAAMGALHVCYRGKDDANCGKCEKCLRMLVSLELLGRVRACPTFPAASLDVGRVARIFVGSNLLAYYEELAASANRVGRRDIETAVLDALRRSSPRRGLVRLSDRLRSRRFFWRAAGPLNRAALAGTVL